MLAFWGVSVPSSENYLYQNLDVLLLSSVTDEIRVTRDTELRGESKFPKILWLGPGR